MEKFSRRIFFCNYRCRFFLKEARTFSRPFCPNLSTMLGLRAWGDDLVAVLFEFQEDDTKLAQSCTDWLYVQHWYTVVPEPSTLSLNKNAQPSSVSHCVSLLSHVSVVPCVFVLCVLPRLPESDKKVSIFFSMASKSVDTR